MIKKLLKAPKNKSAYTKAINCIEELSNPYILRYINSIFQEDGNVHVVQEYAEGKLLITINILKEVI